MPDHTSQDFGSRLREARERRGVTLRQIANATKISVVALGALERNEVSRLPGGIFSRAFVRSYAIEVGLDPEATIQDFIAQFPRDDVTAGHPAVDHVEDPEAHESEERMASTVLRLVLVSVPLAGILLYWAATGAGRAAPPVPAPAVIPDTSEALPPPLVQPIEIPPVTDVALVQAVPAASPAAAAGQLTVTLSAERPCWVSAVADGRPVIQRLLAAGEREVVNVQHDLVLTAGDASALTLTLNGRPARGLGGSGEVVTARMNLDNYMEFLASP